MHDAEGLGEISQTLQQALDGDRDAAEVIWRHIARDGPDREDKEHWLECVAKRVVEDVLTAEAKERPQAALRALGLSGRGDRHSELRLVLSTLRSFQNLDAAPGTKARKLGRQELLGLVQELGYLQGLSQKQALRVLDNLIETTSFDE